MEIPHAEEGFPSWTRMVLPMSDDNLLSPQVLESMKVLANIHAELAARKRTCACQWFLETGLLPNRGCFEHGVEHDDLINLGRAARDAGVDVEMLSRVRANPAAFQEVWRRYRRANY